MDKNSDIPKFVSVVSIALGCVDLLRGFMHTILLEYAAGNIAGLDLSTSQAGDLFQLMGSFGISNYITGAMLIIMGWKARQLALAMLGIIPAAYLLGTISIKINTASYASTQTVWGGIPMMMVYFAVCIITFLTGLWTSRK